jgi:ribonuclease HI
MGLPKVEAFTDGACKGNPGAGGWGVLLRYGVHEKKLYGGQAHATNNQMELMAAIQALEALTKPCEVHITTDSVYVKQGITEWIHRWLTSGWRTAQKKPVKNQALWQRLYQATQKHEVIWHWIKGHAGHQDNETADALACQGALENKF